MQWLIDIILARIAAAGYFTDSFVWRGPSADFDWELPNVTIDNAWHDLYVGDIVPAGASAVMFQCMGTHTTNGGIYRMAHVDATALGHFFYLQCRTANLNYNLPAVIGLNSERKIRYRFSTLNWSSFDLTIKGWWL